MTAAKKKLAPTRTITIVLSSEPGGMSGDWVATSLVEGALPVVGARGRWFREGREDDAPIALLAELSADGPRERRSEIRGRHGDGEQVISEVVQSIAFELF